MLNTLFANDVRQTLDHFRRSVDQMFENFYGYQNPPAAVTGERTWAFSPLLESAWSNDFLHLRAILPGVAESDVRVTVQNNHLVIEGERKAPEGVEFKGFTQLAYGRFYAAWAVPAGLDLDHVQCRLANGILEIKVPILEASKPRQIPVQTPEQKAITA